MVTDSGRTHGLNTLRFLNQPIPIEVTMNRYSGEPSRIIQRGRATFVRTIFDTWTVNTYWWRKRALQRVYFSIVTADETILTVYKDSLNGGWYAQNA